MCARVAGRLAMAEDGGAENRWSRNRRTGDDPPVALINEGNALEEQGRSAEAMARYDAAVQADARCARVHLNPGQHFVRSRPARGGTRGVPIRPGLRPALSGPRAPG